MKDSLIWPVADSFDIPLHVLKVDGQEAVRGACTRTLKVGGWVVEAEQIVRSDCVSIDGAKAGYFVRMHGAVWAYAIVEDVGAGQSGLELNLFDSTVINLHVKDIPTFGGESIEATMEKLAPALRSKLVYDLKKKAWKSVNAGNLVVAS